MLSRADDMINVRGVNVYPASVEAVLRRVPEVAEFRSTISRTGTLATLTIDVEAVSGCDVAALPARVAHALRTAFGLTVPVHVVAAGSLPRFDMKSRRFVVHDGPEA